MKIRLHEIELGAADVKDSSSFYQTILGLQPGLLQENLAVMNAGMKGLDFNLSRHFPQGAVAISFLTDDLAEIENRLKEAGVVYESPKASHLGMTTIQFRDANGYIIKVNTPGVGSPSWLSV